MLRRACVSFNLADRPFVSWRTAKPQREIGERLLSHRKKRTPGARVVKWAALPEAEGRVDLSTLPGDAVRELASSPPVVRVVGTTIRYLKPSARRHECPQALDRIAV
jgi:siroheme synthase